MHRRSFLKAGSVLSIGCVIGCSPRVAASAATRRRMVELVPVDVAFDRIIRTTVGLRPYRESGFVVRAEPLGDKLLIHNYGHGGAGMSLSWGTAHLAADLALARDDRHAAVIGCGVVGLTTARMLQRRGFAVTIHAAALPPDTTSNMSWASFTPLSGLISVDRRTSEWDTQFRSAAATAYRELQLLVGRDYGVSWVDEYAPTDMIAAAGGAIEAGRTTAEGMAAANPLLPGSVNLGRTVLQRGEHPFATQYARRRPALRFEPSIYLDALLRDVLMFGGRIVVRSFATPQDVAALAEPIVVNCTGLGAKQLFGDTELTPVKGQLVVLVPQPEVDYILGGMLPRRDGIVLGHTMERGVWTLDVNEAEVKRVVEQHMRTFSAMRVPGAGLSAAAAGASQEFAPASPLPPVESFFDRES